MAQKEWFDAVVNRENTGAAKWDEIKGMQKEQLIPLTTADMEFPVCEAVREAVEKRARHGIFGYTKPDDRFYHSVISFIEKHHHFKVDSNMLVCTTSVIPAITAGILSCSGEKDGVILFTPGYTGFYQCIERTNRTVVECSLKYQKGSYQLDVETFRMAAKERKNRVVILCNPHNPIGKVWRKEELEEILSICKEEGLYVISDEIHWDLILEGSHTSIGQLFMEKFQEMKSKVILCTAPTKTFNLAGVMIAYSIVFDEDLRHLFEKQLLLMGQGKGITTFGYEATIAAYTHGEEWLYALCEYIKGNVALLREWLTKHYPEIRMMRVEGTYLAWLDCRCVLPSFEQWMEQLREKGVYFTDGSYFGKDGAGFVRVNLALPRSELNRILSRIENEIITTQALPKRCKHHLSDACDNE